MITIKSFTFNPFQENTYIAFDETNECIIVDPGCYDHEENKILKSYIEENHLNIFFPAVHANGFFNFPSFIPGA